MEIAPAERLTIERVKRFVADLGETNISYSVAKAVHALFLAVRLMMPDRDWSWLKALKGQLYAVVPARTRTGPVITSVQLLDLGQHLMDESTPTEGIRISRSDAVRFRDGLMIAFLAFVPIRRRNLAALEIDRHLVKEGDRWFVIVPRDETKTGAPMEFPIPELLKSYLAVYLDILRPRLLRGRTANALWVSSWGTHLSYSIIGDIISRRSLSYFGFCISPHDARDAAATTWAIAAPDRIGVARDLLTHRDLRTTGKYYNRARGIEASRAHGQVIAAMRRRNNRRTG